MVHMLELLFQQKIYIVLMLININGMVLLLLYLNVMGTLVKLI